MKSLIVGLGNPVLCDDGVGIHVVRRLREMELPDGVEVVEAGTAGLALLDLISGYDRLIVVDAIDAGLPAGTVKELTLDDLASAAPLHLSSSHDANLVAVCELGRTLGLPIPLDVRIVAIQIADAQTFSEACTPEVAKAIGPACEAAVALSRAIR